MLGQLTLCWCQDCPEERDGWHCARLEPVNTTAPAVPACPPCAIGDAIYLGSGTASVDGAGWVCTGAAPALLPATGQIAFGEPFPWVDILHGGYTFISSPCPGGKHGGYWLFGLERVQLVVSSERVRKGLWRGTPTEFYWEDSPDQRTLIREVIVYDVNGDALRFIGQTPIDPGDETRGWDFRPAAGVYAQLAVDGQRNRFILTGGPPGAMRQPGGWIYRFEVSNRPPIGSPYIPDWGNGMKAMLRNKLEAAPGGSGARPLSTGVRAGHSADAPAITLTVGCGTAGNTLTPFEALINFFKHTYCRVILV